MKNKIWQPIKTAPKDGTPILAWGRPGKDDKPYTDFAVIRWCSCLREWHLCDGEDESWIGSTHWMPIPNPPQ